MMEVEAYLVGGARAGVFYMVSDMANSAYRQRHLVLQHFLHGARDWTGRIMEIDTGSLLVYNVSSNRSVISFLCSQPHCDS